MDQRLSVNHLKSMALIPDTVTDAGVCQVKFRPQEREFVVVGENDHTVGTVEIDKTTPEEAVTSINQMVSDEHERL